MNDFLLSFYGFLAGGDFGFLAGGDTFLIAFSAVCGLKGKSEKKNKF